MLHLWIGEKEFENDAGVPDFYFMEEMDLSCIDTDFGHRVLHSCSDVAKVINYATLELPNGELVSPREISSGAKTCLILMFDTEDVVCDLLFCGENCEPFIAEAANQRDITCKTSRWFFPKKWGFKDGIHILNTDTVVHDIDEYMYHIIETGLSRLV